MTDLVRAAHEIADALTETLDDDQRIGFGNFSAAMIAKDALEGKQ